MRRIGIFLCVGLCLTSAGQTITHAQAPAANGTKSTVYGSLTKKWLTARQSPSDLEVTGDLKGLPAGSTRYIKRGDLLALPQTSFTAVHDEKFTGPTPVSGVPFDELIRALGREPGSDLVIAVASDGYRSNFPAEYIAAHHPLLVLEINGKAPAEWPKDADHGVYMGPYTVSYGNFVPSFKIFAHADEEQIPWGVIRLEFRDQKTVFGAIEPRGLHAKDVAVEAGYRIARQNCFRCHSSGSEGGQKSQRPWLVLSAWATASPDFFTAYVRDPKTKNPLSQMPGNPGYDDSTMRALIAYFRTFISASPEPR
jgi:mono/diheme cytochrome c family protein